MQKKNGTDDRIAHKVKTANVKTGDVMAFVYYVKVKKVLSNTLDVDNLDGNLMNFEVRGSELIERGFSADQFEEEVKVSKTHAAEILVSSLNRPLTVAFEKADGTERILRGRLVTPEPLLGRSMCEDLDITSKDRLRLVDHRTIRWIVVEGVKYVVNTR